jgi:hypothetical protein
MPGFTIDRSPRPNDPFVAEVLRRLLARAPDSLDPWLPFPQNACSYRFGRPPRCPQPLPVGALWRLWDTGFPFRAPCLACDAMLHMVSMGGLLTIGGGRLVCPGCGGGFFCSIGNVSRVGALVAERLKGTEFQPIGFVFGGSVGSDGAALLAELGLPPLRQPEEGSVVRADGIRTRLGFDTTPATAEAEVPRGVRTVPRGAAAGKGDAPRTDVASGGARVRGVRAAWSLILNRLGGG